MEIVQEVWKVFEKELYVNEPKCSVEIKRC